MEKSKKNIRNKKAGKVVKKKIKKTTGKSFGGVDIPLFITIITLLVIGIVMIYSASSYYALYEDGSTSFFLKKIVTWAVVGLVLMIVTMNIDYRIYRNKVFTLGIYIVTILLLIIALKSSSINGATRWINIAGLSIQPSEFAKYVAVFCIAFSIDFGKKNIRKFWKGTILNLAIAGVLAALILLGKNLSITAIVMMVAFIMVFVSGARKIHTLSLIPVGLVVGILFIFTESYRMDRLMSFMNPWKDPTGKSYQLIQSLYALGSGGVFGVGLGQSRQKMLFIPEPHNDFIFSIIGEEFGLIGCIVVIGLFAYVVKRGISIAIKTKDTYGFLLAVGIVAVIALQAIINIAVVSGSMPVTGVPMPFISYGGTALVVNMAAVGVLLNISRSRKEISGKKILKV